MVLSKRHQLLQVGLIGCFLALSSVGCQQADTTSEAPVASPQPTATPTPPAATTPETPVVEEPQSTATPAPQPPAATEQTCSASAFVADTDPAGLNVRGGPGSDFPVIDNLPTDGPVEVTIAGYANGWMKLNVAWSAQQQELEQPGWVYAPLLGVTTTNSNLDNPDGPVSLYSSPDGSASVKAEVPKFAEATLLSCSGNWLEVDAGGTTGWLAVGDQCSSPVTTCK